MTKYQIFNFLDTCEEDDTIYVYLQGRDKPISVGYGTGRDILAQKCVVEIVSEDQTRLIAAFEYKDLQILSKLQLL